MGCEITVNGTRATVTMCWPRQRNALGLDEAQELATAIREARRPDTTALVLASDGAFSAGGKLPEFVRLGRELDPEELSDRVYGVMQDVVRALAECPVPTIAAVDGPAIGLGMDIALACDMRFIGPDGYLLQGWGRAGLIPGTGGVQLLERLDPTLLWRLLADQPRLDADACARAGLAEVGSPSAASAAAVRAERLSGLGRPTLEAYVALSRSSRLPTEDHNRLAARLQGVLLTSSQFQQRAAALLSGSL
jgi:enoyl-CoA hydratase/carnithine racemase